MKKIILLVLAMAILTLAGCLKVRSYSLSFDVQGGDQLPSKSVKVTEVIEISSLPIPTRENFIFKGWYFKLTDNDPITERFSIMDNVSIFAKWEEDLSPKVTYEFTEDLVRWEHNYQSYSVFIGDKEVTSSTAQFDFSSYQQDLLTPKQIKIYGKEQEQKHFLFATTIYYRDISTVIDVTSFKDIAIDKFFTTKNTLLLGNFLSLKKTRNELSWFETKDINTIAEINLSATATPAGQILRISYSEDKITYTTLKEISLNSIEQTISVNIDNPKPVYLRFESLSSNYDLAYINIHKMTLKTNVRGYQLVEIK